MALEWRGGARSTSVTIRIVPLVLQYKSLKTLSRTRPIKQNYLILMHSQNHPIFSTQNQLPCQTFFTKIENRFRKLTKTIDQLLTCLVNTNMSTIKLLNQQKSISYEPVESTTLVRDITTAKCQPKRSLRQLKGLDCDAHPLGNLTHVTPGGAKA